MVALYAINNDRATEALMSPTHQWIEGVTKAAAEPIQDDVKEFPISVDLRIEYVVLRSLLRWHIGKWTEQNWTIPPAFGQKSVIWSFRKTAGEHRLTDGICATNPTWIVWNNRDFYYSTHRPWATDRCLKSSGAFV